MNSAFSSLTGYYLLGIRHLRIGSGVGLLAILYFSLAVLLAVLLALTTAWFQATTAHMDKNGFNRITITTTNTDGLNESHLPVLAKRFPVDNGFRLLPEYTTMVHLQAVDGS